MSEEQNRFSLRKLSVGLASVLIGVSIFGTSQTVKADTVANNQTSSVTNNAQSSDTQKNENVAKSTFSNDNQANSAKSNLIQTQDEGKKDQKQDSVPKTQEATDGSNLDAEKDIVGTSSLQESDNQSNNHAEDNSQTQLNITKNSQQLDQKELATNLTQDNSTQNNDWADPAKQGFTKTAVGWTKHAKDYNGIAKSSNTTIKNAWPFLNDWNQNKPASIDVKQGFNWGPTINDVVIDKSLIKKGNNILVSAIPYFSKDSRGERPTPQDNTNINVVSNGVHIGSVYKSIDNNEIDYYLNVTLDDNVANDIKFGFSRSGAEFEYSYWNSQYKSFRGTTPENPAQFRIITTADGKDHDYDYSITTDGKKVKPYELPDNQNVSEKEWRPVWIGGPQWNNISVNNDRASGTHRADLSKNPYKARHYDQVIQYSIIKNPDGTEGSFNLSVTPQMQLKYLLYLLNKDHKALDKEPVYSASVNQYPKFKKLADNMTAVDVQKAAQKGHFVYSVDSSEKNILFGINFSDDWNSLEQIGFNKDQVINGIKNFADKSYSVNIGDADNAQSDIDSTLQFYKDNNYEPLGFSFTISNVITNRTGTVMTRTIDVTPTTNDETKTPMFSSYDFEKSKSINVDASFYRTLHVKYVDDDNNQKELYDKPLTQLANGQKIYTGSDLHLIIGKDVPVTDNVILSDLQPDLTKFNYDPTTKTFYYGVVKDTNPDIVIHVRHLVKIISGDADLDLYPEIKKALNGDARRTITITYPAGKQRNNPSTIVQSVHYIRSGKVDFTNDTVDESSLTKWNPVASSAHGVTITNGETTFDAVKLPHINGYKAHLVRNKINPAMLMVSFVAVPSKNKPSLPDEVAPSKPSAPTDNPNHSAWTNLDHKVVDALNQSDSGWTMPDTQPATYTVEVPADDAIIDLSDLVIAEPVHAQTRTQIRVTKRFKLRKHGKKHVAKHLKHRKKAVRTFKKYRL